MLLKVLLVESSISDDSFSAIDDLSQQGCDVTVVHDVLRACQVSEQEWPDLLVVNACNGLPQVGELCQALDEANSDFPRILISDTKTHNNLPADAHLLIPFSPRQLSHRIRKATKTQPERFVRAGDVIVDTVKNRARCGDRTAHLTPKEMRLLRLLMEHPGQILERRMIMKEVWDTEYLGDTRTLEVHIRWIRTKLEENPKHPQHIITVRGQGYYFQIIDNAAT